MDESSGLFAEPVAVASPDDCTFYHSMDLPVSGSRAGHWDLRGRFDQYVAGAPLDGKSVLDVGAASGFLSFEAEKRGARVVSVDAADARFLDRLPFVQNQAMRDRRAWELNANAFLDGIKRSYWLARRELNARTRVFYGNACDLPAELGAFDVVIVGQILVHLRDTIGALTSIAARCRDTLIIAEGMLGDAEPRSHMLGRVARPDLDFSFWHHSIGFYREILGMLGFAVRTVATRDYTCNLAEGNRGIPITTIVFQRVSE